MSRRLRLIVLVLGGLAVAAALGAIVVVYLLLQPDRFTAMLQTQARGAGLELSLASPASPTLFPRPALDLRGITLSAEGAHAPILLAARGRLALPWSTLFGGPTVISQLQIDSPRVDLDALQAWMAALPTQVQHAPPDTPRIEGNALQLNDISLHLSQAAAVSLSLNGRARWHGAADAAASLAGTLDRADAARYAISLTLTPANQDYPLLLALKLDGPDNHADLRLPPLALARWWSQLDDPKGPQLGIPPGSGHAEFGSIDAGGVHIEGLRMLAGDNVPVAAGTSAAPARPAVAR